MISAGTIGLQIRFIGGAIAFGYWQNSIVAGVFAYCLLVTLDHT